MPALTPAQVVAQLADTQLTLFKIVNGPAAGPDSDVETESGLIPTVAKVQAAALANASGTLLLSIAVATAAGMTLQQANDAAEIAGAILDLDDSYVLTANTTLTAKGVRHSGGAVTLGNFGLSLGTAAILSNPVQMFNCNGTGRVTGNPQWPVVYPQNFGAKADDAADDLVAVQMASDFCKQSNFPSKIYLAGRYKISDSVTVGPNSKFIGGGRALTKVTCTHATHFAFKYLTQGGAGGDVNCALAFEDFTLQATNGIQLNETGLTGPNFTTQSALKYVRITGMSIIGGYNAGLDASADTNTPPSLSDLTGFGVGISCSKVFDAVITGNSIEYFGIGAYLEGSDLNRIKDNRFAYCARWVHAAVFGNFGGQNLIEHNDMLANRRYGGIYLDGNPYTRVRDNYCETYTAAATYIVTRNDIGTLIDANRMDNPGVAGVKLYSLAPNYGCKVRSNDIGVSTPLAAGEILSTYYNVSIAPFIGAQSPLVLFLGNGPGFPTPSFPNCIYEYNDPRKWSPYNPKPLGSTVGAGSAFPYIFNATTGKWGLPKTPSGCTIAMATQIHDYKFLVRVTGGNRSGACFMNVFWGGTNCYGANAGFTNGAGTEVVTFTITKPGGVDPDSGLSFGFINADAELYGIELIPVA